MQIKQAYQQLIAPNDRNGNPRRLWLITEWNSAGMFFTEAIDEDFGGKPKEATGAELPTINIDAVEYKRLLKKYGEEYTK